MPRPIVNTQQKKPKLAPKHRPKRDNTLSLKQIPTKNRVNVIDNFSQYSDFVIEGDKLYRSDKGKSRWKELKNDRLQYLILKFLKNNYDFKGYQDNEREVYRQLSNRYDPTPYSTERYAKDLMAKKAKQTKLEETGSETTQVKQTKPKPKLAKKSQVRPVTNPFTFSVNPQSLKVSNPSSDIGYIWNDLLSGKIRDVYQTIKNGLARKKMMKDPDYVDPTTSFSTKQTNDTTSRYGIRPLSIVGDTIPVTKTSNRFQINLPDGKQYILPESILPGDYQFATRNRGEFTPINTEGAIVTSMQQFYPYDKRQLVSDRGVHFKNYIGIDRNGNLKAGPAEAFGPGDMMAGTFANEIVSIDTDEKGNVVGSRQKKNTSKIYPNFTYIDDSGQERHTTNSTALNFLMDPNNPNSANMYGSVYGGRVLIKAGNELRLVSGSVNDINREFEAMKQRNGVRSATFYALDNGTYAKGIRTYDQRITARDLREYDRVNSTGGSFLYITNRTPQQSTFRSDTVWTPNVRTVNDESYKKGHGLVNERKGIVLHHTGFMDDPSLSRVTGWLTRPGGESAHVIIGEDGTRKVLARPDQVTFHGGHSMWNNRANVNDFMLGIEFQGDTNKKDLTPQQIQSAVEYMAPIIRENNIRLEDITTHQQVRDLYNDYVSRNGGERAPNKPDINQANYERVISALLDQVYYTK